VAGLVTAAAAALAWLLMPRAPAAARSGSGGTAGPDAAAVDGP
jgi:hypothetical protein